MHDNPVKRNGGRKSVTRQFAALQAVVVGNPEKIQMKVRETLDFIGFFNTLKGEKWFKGGLETDFDASFRSKRAVEQSTAL